MKQLFKGIYSDSGRLFTKNLVPNAKVYGERLEKHSGVEFREWVPWRSKLAAAVKNGLKQLPVREGGKILYLGSSEGTTVSHVSDIVGKDGLVFGVDVSERVMRKFLQLCEVRNNIVPVLADANQPESYAEHLKGLKIDLLYQDISQKNQAEIFNRNAEMFLAKAKNALIAIKARSISQKGKAAGIFEKEINKLKEQFKILQQVNLAPFEKDHCMVWCEKK